MPRQKMENKKQVVAVRLTPEMAAEVRRLSPDNFSEAIVTAIAEWLARQRRKAAKADPLAKHLAPPSPRERAIRGRRAA